MLTRAHERVEFHWSSAIWALCVLIYILQLWWVGWGLRDVDLWAFMDFIVLVISSIFLYGAAEMALPAPEESKIDMLEQSKGLGRLSAASMLLYFLVGPYVNIAMYGNAIIPSIAVPSVGIMLMVLVISFPARFKTWAIFFTIYSLAVLALTV